MVFFFGNLHGNFTHRHTKKSAKPSNFNFLTNQRPATEILTNDITWREIHFGFWTNQKTIRSLLASLNRVKELKSCACQNCRMVESYSWPVKYLIESGIIKQHYVYFRSVLESAWLNVTKWSKWIFASSSWKQNLVNENWRDWEGQCWVVTGKSYITITTGGKCYNNYCREVLQ